MNNIFLVVLGFILVIFFVYMIPETIEQKPLPLEISENNADMKKIKYTHGVPEVVFIVWFGRKISQNRLDALNSLTKNIQIPYILITEDNYKDYEVQEHPIHEGFEYLSGNHKSDYLRAYLLNFYGGAYHDIKYRDLGWENEWEVFKDDNVWMKSFREISEDHIGYDLDNPETKKIQKEYNDLGSMCWIISRSKTKYTEELLEKIDSKLDKHLESLKKHPSTEPAGYYSDRPMEKLRDGDKYPLRWLELMGEHFHLLMHKYKNHMVLDLPRPNLKNYR